VRSEALHLDCWPVAEDGFRLPLGFLTHDKTFLIRPKTLLRIGGLVTPTLGETFSSKKLAPFVDPLVLFPDSDYERPCIGGPVSRLLPGRPSLRRINIR